MSNLRGDTFVTISGFVTASESDDPPSLNLADLGNASAVDSVKQKKFYNPLSRLQRAKPANYSTNNNHA